MGSSLPGCLPDVQETIQPLLVDRDLTPLEFELICVLAHSAKVNHLATTVLRTLACAAGFVDIDNLYAKLGFRAVGDRIHADDSVDQLEIAVVLYGLLKIDNDNNVELLTLSIGSEQA